MWYQHFLLYRDSRLNNNNDNNNNNNQSNGVFFRSKIVEANSDEIAKLLNEFDVIFARNKLEIRTRRIIATLWQRD